MTAAPLAHAQAVLPLLYEPDLPPDGKRAVWGWRRKQYESGRPGSQLVRRHDDDLYGALVQHAIARYVLLGASRSSTAARLVCTERSAQYVLRGLSCGPYGEPVLRALRRLGVGTDRGNRTNGQRHREIEAAARHLMHQAADALDGQPINVTARDRLIADLRLLSLGWDGAP